MEYEVKIDEFEGPLDLLLHLIKESKMDIINIQVELIADQYLDYIRKMDEMNLNVASEYLVMASELVEMKSKLLLPRHEETIEEDEEDPKESLVKRLIEYQRYKDLTKDFKELAQIRQEIYTKLPENLTEYATPNTIVTTDVTVDDLVLAFERFLQRQKLSQPIDTKVTRKELSITQRRREISLILKEKKRVCFFELFDILTREYIVVTFLTVLEMAKEKQLVIEQEDNFDEIYCCQSR